MKNLKENNFISEKEYLNFKDQKIKIKRRKIEIVNEANSYTEEVRRLIKEKYGFEKLYTQGLSIKSPLDIDYQIKAIESLRQGIDAYDKRRGWRGPITNKFTNPNWENKIKSFDIDPTLNWKNGEIILLTNEDITVKLLNEKQIKINKTNLNWALKGKEINDVFKLGDFIFVKKEWHIKKRV